MYSYLIVSSVGLCHKLNSRHFQMSYISNCLPLSQHFMNMKCQQKSPSGHCSDYSLKCMFSFYHRSLGWVEPVKENPSKRHWLFLPEIKPWTPRTLRCQSSQLIAYFSSGSHQPRSLLSHLSPNLTALSQELKFAEWLIFLSVTVLLLRDFDWWPWAFSDMLVVRCSRRTGEDRNGKGSD